ncbi:MAG: hypothetical protein H6873_00480 [Hyphomicrobiaceae bacterium]|nr:hypothetical protein [Hyphomicrobiaceae bacterium]
MRVRLNGDGVYDSRSVGRWDPLSLATALVPLSREILVAGDNRLALIVGSGPVPMGGLSKILVGPLEAVQSIYYARVFLKDTARPILFGMQLLLAISGLLVFRFRPADRTFGWLGLLMTFTSLLGAGVLTNIAPDIEIIMRYAFLMLPATGLSLLGFSLSLTRYDLSRQIFVLLLGVTIGAFVFSLGFGVPAGDISFGFSVPFMIVSVLISSVILIRTSISEPLPEILLFVVGLVLLAIGLAHDFAIRLGFIENGLLLGVFSRLFSVVAIAIFIVRRVVSQAEQHEQATGDIRQSARNALMDLRLVVDTTAVKSESLRYYLGLLRDRVIQPLENLGIKIVWSTTRLPVVEAVHPEQALNLMRILQEAVNNAMRHSDLKILNVDGRQDSAGEITLVLTTKGFASEARGGSGRGITNMQRRAAELGAEIALDITSTGSEFVLRLPVSSLQ